MQAPARLLQASWEAELPGSLYLCRRALWAQRLGFSLDDDALQGAGWEGRLSHPASMHVEKPWHRQRKHHARAWTPCWLRCPCTELGGSALVLVCRGRRAGGSCPG